MSTASHARTNILALLTLTALVAATPTPAPAGLTDVLVATKKLVLNDDGTTAGYKTKIVIKDPVIDPADADPTITGASIYFYSNDRGDFSDAIGLPDSGWTAKGKGYAFKIADKDAGVVIVAKIKPGKLVFKTKGADFNYDLLGQPESGSIAYRFSFDSSHHVCGLVPGMEGTVKKDDPVKGIYVAKKGEAPAGCPAFID